MLGEVKSSAGMRLKPRRRFAATDHRSDTIVIDRSIHDVVFETGRTWDKAPHNAVVSLGDPRHFRVQGESDRAHGHYEYCGLDEGFFTVISDITYCRPASQSIRAGNMLRVRLATFGDGEYAASDELLDLKGPSASIVIEPNDQPPADAVLADHQRSVEVYVSRDMLARLYPRERQELPAAVKSFLLGDLRRTVTRRLPFGSHLLNALEGLQNCPLSGGSRRLIIRSHSIEILCYALEAMRADEGTVSPKTTRLAAEGVLKARQLLDAQFIDPPSLVALAQTVGLSRSGLCVAFRQIVGQSVFDYILGLRMKQALTMLTTADLTIAEVAYAVGYVHPSSFSVAVQRYFGMTASELRQRAIAARQR